MLCQVKLIRPDGSRARHVGHYPNPGMAMDVVQALHPDCTVHAATQTTARSNPPTQHAFVQRTRSGGELVNTQASGRSCDELGVCQSTTKPCPSHTICARNSSPFYFAPGAIDNGAADKRDWLLETHWTDWVAGVAILVILGIIYGYMS